MSSILGKLFIQYNSISNNKVELSDKIKLIKKELQIDYDFDLFFIGILNDFIVNEPQYYYNKEVKNEVFNNLNTLYNQDSEVFITSFLKNQYKFFHSINSYHNILDLYNEFDDVGFDSETKTKIYYLPIITQLMEFCLNHFYRGISSIIGDLKGKNYEIQKKLGSLKDILKKDYPNLVDINIDFRNSISHGTVEILTNKIIYSDTREELEFSQLDSIKNNLFDISSGALVGLFHFMIEKNIINEKYFSKIDDKTTIEILKLFLHNENIRVKSFSEGTIGSAQMNIHLEIKNINDRDNVKHLLLLVAKIMYVVFPKYERYFVDFKHPFSLGGMVSFDNSTLKENIYSDTIQNIDSMFLIHDIQNTNIDNRSYKFHTFPKLKGSDWEVTSLRDNSVKGIKRFEARLIIDMETISKKEVESLLFNIIRIIRQLENKSNPITKIKYGKIEADVVRLMVFYKSNKREEFSLFQNNKKFICLTHYYKSKSVSKITVPFQDNYTFENLKKFDIYWNKNHEEK